jgi:hypothetical protein
VDKLFTAIETYLKNLENHSESMASGSQLRVFEIIHSFEDNRIDPYSSEINAAVNKIEKFLKPRLKI